VVRAYSKQSDMMDWLIAFRTDRMSTKT